MWRFLHNKKRTLLHDRGEATMVLHMTTLDFTDLAPDNESDVTVGVGVCRKLRG